MSFALIPLQIILIGIDLVISILTFGWVGVLKKLLSGSKKKLRTVPVGDDPSHRVVAEFKGKLATVPSNGATDLYSIFSITLKNHGSSVCMRKREFLGWKSKKVKEFGPTVTDWTYEEVGRMAHKFGAALAGTGVVASDPTTTLDRVTKPCRVAIFENTCPEWMVAALGAFSQSVAVVTIYATLGVEAVMEAVVDNSITAIVCNKASVGYLVENSNKMPGLKTIVYTSDLIGKNDSSVELPTSVPPGVTVVSIEDFIESGDTSKHPVVVPSAETAAVIMYTSGSTGKPKGVVVKHSAIVAGIAAAEIILRFDETFRYLGYLPLAHIMELMVEFVCLANGASISYADPKTLTTSGAYPTGALETYKPSHMVAVPKIWDTIKKAIMSKVMSSSPVAQTLVKTALKWREFATSIGLDTPLFNALVFKKFQLFMGGNMKHAISGGGPLNGEVQNFIRVAFGFPLVQGYGLTETCAGLTMQDADDPRPGVAGTPAPCVEVRVDSCPDICDKAGFPYLSTDRKDVDGNDIWGRGEVMVKGGNVTTGYYMMPEKTKEVYSDDGWFATGDIGQFTDDGVIKIVDRKKNLVKLKGGEYVALEKMEMVYGNSDFVDALAGGICCYGDGDMDRCVALMQLSKPAAMKWAKENGLGDDYDMAKRSKELNGAVMESFKSEHGNSDLSRLEKLQGCVLLDSPWTPENGCLTAANKLQRRAVVAAFSKEFEEVKKKGIFN